MYYNANANHLQLIVLVHIISDTFADYLLFSHVAQSFKAAWAVDGRGAGLKPCTTC